MACITMNDRLWNTTKKLVNHDGFVIFGDGVEGFLNHVTAKCVHTQTQGVASDSVSNRDHLFGGAVFKTSLHKEVPKTVNHKRIGLSDYGFDDLILLFDRTHF